MILTFDFHQQGCRHVGHEPGDEVFDKKDDVLEKNDEQYAREGDVEVLFAEVVGRATFEVFFEPAGERCNGGVYVPGI